MITRFTEIHNGYCPELDEDDHAVQATLLRYFNGHFSETKLESVRCPDNLFCKQLKIKGNCPLLNAVVAMYR